MFIMVAFIIMGSLASIQLFGPSGVNVPLLYSESEKMFSRAMLYDRNIRNGVAYVLETGKCVNNAEGSPPQRMEQFRDALISANSNTDPLIRNHSKFTGGANTGLDHCLLGFDLPKNITINSFELGRIRPFGTIGTQFSATVDFQINAKGSAANPNQAKDDEYDPRQLKYRTLTSDQTMIFKSLTPNELGYIFKTTGGNDTALIDPQTAILEFNSPVYIHNTGQAEAPITNLMKAIGHDDSSPQNKGEKHVFFSHPVRTNFTTLSYSKDNKKIPIGLARSYFSRGITTGRWTTSDAKSAIQTFIDMDGDDPTPLEWSPLTTSTACNDTPIVASSSIAIKAPTPSPTSSAATELRYGFCGYISAPTLTLDLSELRPDESEESELIVRFDGGFIIEKLEIELNAAQKPPLIQFFNNQSFDNINSTDKLKDLYLVSM